jgi:hypothetical protein
MTDQRTGHAAAISYGATEGVLTTLVARSVHLHTETLAAPLIDALEHTSAFEQSATRTDWIRATPWQSVVMFDTALGLPALQLWNVVRIQWPVYSGESTAARLQGPARLVSRSYPTLISGQIMQSLLTWQWDQLNSNSQLTFTAAT